MSRGASLPWILTSLFAVGPLLADEDRAGAFTTAIESAQQRIVKIYGASLGREVGYGSGVLVSGDGRILTTLSILLESPSLRVVLADGRRLAGTVVRRSAKLQLAEIRIEASDLPYFELDSSEHLQPGDWLISAANPFKVAVGPELASVTAGMFSGRATLAARRRAQQFAYTGPVLLTDIIVATPGSAGGALVDLDGNLVGLIGKPVISTRTNTWANYALPVEQLSAFLRSTTDESSEADTSIRPASVTEAQIGARLFNVGGRTRPAFVERVRHGSPAKLAGLRTGDLILAVNETSIETCDDYTQALADVVVDEPITLTIKRRDEVLSIVVTLEGSAE